MPIPMELMGVASHRNPSLHQGYHLVMAIQFAGCLRDSALRYPLCVILSEPRTEMVRGEVCSVVRLRRTATLNVGASSNATKYRLYLQ